MNIDLSLAVSGVNMIKKDLTLLLLIVSFQSCFSDPPKGAYVHKLEPLNPYDIRGDDIDKGGEVSKACRYDEPEWTDCDPFEMIRYRYSRKMNQKHKTLNKTFLWQNFEADQWRQTM